MRRAAAVLMLSALGAPLAAQSYTDPSTGVAFPTSLTPPRGAGAQALTGTGVRTRTMLKVKVYAFGLYVDAAGAKAALAAWAGKSAEQLQADDAFYAKILERPFATTMRLVMTRNVDGATMAEAFNEALGPRVQAAAGRGMTGGEAALQQFRGFFGDRVANGTELVFACTPDGGFSTTIGGTAKPDIQSPALCWALFDVYLGADPISPDGKKSVIASFPAILR
jgi:hypothetical protein